MNIWRKVVVVTFMLGLCAGLKAEELWDNGENTGDIMLGNYFRILEDFYVPGAGWWIDSAEVYGTFYNNWGENHNIGSVSMRIMSADFHTGEPDPSQGNGLNVVAFNEFQIANNGVRVEIDFQKTFLKGGRFYWIEFEVLDDDGFYMRGFESAGIKHLPAWGDFSEGPSDSLYELSDGFAFKLYGDDVKTVNLGSASDFKADTLDNTRRSWTLNLQGKHKLLKPGMYQIQMQGRLPQLYWFDEDGRHVVDDFKVDGRGEVEFSTPLGDDMCGNAPDILQSYCQNFVACAAYYFCGAIPIP